MKLASSFAFVAGLLCASSLVTPAVAEVSPSAPTLKISGNTVVTAYAVNQKNRKNGKSNGYHLDNAVSDLYFLVIGRATNGLEYKMKINIQAFSAADPVVNQNYIEFNGKFGTFQAGNVVGPEDTMIEDGLAVMGGTGGPDGAYHNVYNLSAFAMRGNDNIGDTGYATKIVYYTPEIYNFRLGVAFTPNTAHRGEEKLNNQTDLGNKVRPGNRTLYGIKPIEPYGLHNIALGLSYKKEVGQWGFNVNGAYINDKSYIPANTSSSTGTRARVRDTHAYQLGGIVGYRRNNGHLVQVGLGYLDNNKSRLPQHDTDTFAGSAAAAGATNIATLATGNAGKAINIGAGYTMGAYKFSGAYQHSKRDVTDSLRARNNVYSLAVDVVPVQGLKFFGELTFVKSKISDGITAATNAVIQDVGTDKSARAVGNNGAAIFMFGSKVSF